ncbi:MAG: ester cyclase, partial [Coleofasciculus sp. C2-GNP5-27]
MSSTLATKIAEANRVLLVEGDFDAIPEYFTQDYVVHLTEVDAKATHGTIREVLTKIRERFSDIEVDVKILLASDNRVAWYRDLRGVQTGSYQGFPATNKPVKWRQMMV